MAEDDDDKKRDEGKGGMTVAEAGRKGGRAVRDKYGNSYFEEIGKKGGATVKAERGEDFFKQIGKKGGDTVKKRGKAFFQGIGRKGGLRLQELARKGLAVEQQSKVAGVDLAEGRDATAVQRPGCDPVLLHPTSHEGGLSRTLEEYVRATPHRPARQSFLSSGTARTAAPPPPASSDDRRDEQDEGEDEG